MKKREENKMKNSAIEVLIEQLEKEFQKFIYFYKKSYQFDFFSSECTKYWNSSTTINNDYINPIRDLLKVYGVKTKIIIDRKKDIFQLEIIK